MTTAGAGRCGPDVVHATIRMLRVLASWLEIQSLTCGDSVEPVTRIELACPAWEAGALPLSYTGARRPRAT